MRRPALIFDFGNVVAHFDFLRAGEALGRRLGLPGQEVLHRAKASGLDALLASYESGQLTARAFSRAFCRLLDVELSHEDFATAWSDIFWLNEPVVALVEFLKSEGYRLVLGSNTNDMHALHFRKQFAEALAHFDRFVLSYEVGAIKPSANFYLACSAAAEAPPHDCLFIDDLVENVEGARAAGLQAIHFKSVAALLQELSEAGVTTPPLGSIEFDRPAG